MAADGSAAAQTPIRDGERGSGTWREVSYDEAIAYIADTMKAVKRRYGTEAMAFACRAGMHTGRFFLPANAFGYPNTFTHELTCPGARSVAYEQTFGTGLNRDYDNCTCLVSLGRSYLEGLHVSQMRSVLKALSKGAKLIYVDPRYGLTASKSDEWLPIKPGTYLAPVQAINTVLVILGSLMLRLFIVYAGQLPA